VAKARSKSTSYKARGRDAGLARPLPAAVVRRGIRRLLCRARPQRPATRLCLFWGWAGSSLGR